MIINRIAGGVPLGMPEGLEDKGSTLFVRPVQTAIGPALASRWEPTPAERDLLLAGGAVYLFVHGNSHPVVSMAIGTHLEGDEPPTGV